MITACDSWSNLRLGHTRADFTSLSRHSPDFFVRKTYFSYHFLVVCLIVLTHYDHVPFFVTWDCSACLRACVKQLGSRSLVQQSGSPGSRSSPALVLPLRTHSSAFPFWSLVLFLGALCFSGPGPFFSRSLTLSGRLLHVERAGPKLLGPFTYYLAQHSVQHPRRQQHSQARQHPAAHSHLLISTATAQQ
jgi:hypothetical protein